MTQSRLHLGLGPRRTSSLRDATYSPQGTDVSAGAWDEIAWQFVSDPVNATVDGEVLTVSPALAEGDFVPNGALVTRAEAYLTTRDGALLVSRVASGDVSVTGETLTVTPTLLEGVQLTGEGFLLDRQGNPLVERDGDYLNVRLEASGDVNVSGETLSVTVSLIDGTVTGTASVTGETLTASPTLTDGSVTGTAVVDGETLSVTVSLIDGSVTTDGNASVSGETLEVTPVLVDGAVAADANVTGETLSVTLSLVDGAVTGTADVSGETLTATPSLVDGSATGDANVAGETLEVTVTLIDGGVTTDGTTVVSGETLLVAVELIDGSVTTDANLGGEILEVAPVLIPGSVSTAAVVEEDDGGNAWEYARQQREKRAQKRRLATPLQIAAKTRLPGLRAVAEFDTRPTLSFDATASLRGVVGQADVFLGVSLDAAHAAGGVRSVAEVRVVNVLDEMAQLEEQMRDLRDMVDLYELMIAA